LAAAILMPPVGRNPDELARQIQAFPQVRASSEVCPSGRQPGKAILKSGRQLAGKACQVWKP